MPKRTVLSSGPLSSWCFKARLGLWYIDVEITEEEKKDNVNFGKTVKAYIQDGPITGLNLR